MITTASNGQKAEAIANGSTREPSTDPASGVPGRLAREAMRFRARLTTRALGDASAAQHVVA
jgi:hypothetical protein